MVTDVETRRWRLQAWSKSNEVIHDGTCVGDRELNDTLTALERRPDFKRSSVTQDAKTGRQTVTTTPGTSAPVPEAQAAPCRECNRREPDCRAISEAVSGHTFVAVGGTA